MTRSAGFVRSLDSVRKAEYEACIQYDAFHCQVLKNREQIPYALRNRQLALAQKFYLAAVRSYLEQGGGSRGSFLIREESGIESHPKLDESWNYRDENLDLRETMQVLKMDSTGTIHSEHVPCRPIPEEEYWFETMWKDYREKKIFTDDNDQKDL